MQINEAQCKRLTFFAKELRRIAPLARHLDWVEVAKDIENILNGFSTTFEYKDAEDLIMEARSCFLYAGLEIPYDQ